MGMSTKQILIGLGAIALIAGLGFASVTLSVGDSGETAPAADTVNVDDYGIDGKVVFPKTPSSADVRLFKAQPENFGNHADWDAADAKSGLEVGVDYHEKTGVTSDTVTFDDLESGTYYLVIEDANYNTVFEKVEQPAKVPQVYADNDKAVKLADGNQMSTAASYGSDNVVSYDSDDNVLATGTDLPAPSENSTETVTIERSIDVDTGVSLLGNLETTSFNDGDGIQDVSVEVFADGSSVYSKSLKDGSSGELADGTSFGEDLADNVDTEPIRSAEEITVSYEVTADMNTQSSGADNGALEDGETILATGLDDVYSADVSTATKTYTR